MRIFRAALTASLISGSPALAGLAASPVIIDKQLTPEDNKLEIVLSNSTPEDMRISFHVGPAEHDRTGSPRVGRPNYRYYIGDRIRLEQPEIVLKAGRWKRIRARVEIPDRPGGGYAFIYARSDPKPTRNAGVGAAVAVGVLVEVTFPNPGKKSVAIEELNPTPSGLTVAIRNDGEAHLKPRGKVEIKDLSGKSVWSSPITPANVFPELVRELKLDQPLPKLPAGRYTVVASVTEPNAVTFERAAASIDGQLVIQKTPPKPAPAAPKPKPRPPAPAPKAVPISGTQPVAAPAPAKSTSLPLPPPPAPPAKPN